MRYVKSHKIISTIVAIAILGTGYYAYGKITATTGEVKYVTSLAKKQTIISTISGSGQVSTTNQVDIKAKVSGDITWVNVKPGDKVYAGQALAGLDNRQAKADLADAEASLIQTKLQFQKDQATAPIDYQKNLDDLETSKQDLVTAFNDSFNSISNTYLDLPGVMTVSQNIIYGYDLSPTASTWNIDTIKNYFSNIDDAREKINILAEKAKSDYATARVKYDSSIISYKQLTRLSSSDEISRALDQTTDTTTAIAQALQSELNLLGAAIDYAQTYSLRLSSSITTLQTSAKNNLSTTNNDLSLLLSQKKTITSTKQNVKTYENNIALLKVGNENGSNPISLQIAQNNLVKQEREVENLKLNLSYYTVVAPFAGTISSVSAQIGQTAGTIASIVTNQQIAELSLNEIDAAKIKIGQKASLTFDAVETLTLTGTVAEIDPVGTVSQGVVSYSVKISFDTQDARIKPGMTANATIQTEIKADVLSVPSSAVKTSNGVSRVQVFQTPIADGGTTGTISSTLPQQVIVTIGISDDTSVEIVSGLEEGEQVVTRTITGTAASNTTAAPSATSLLGGGGNRPTGGVRIGG